MCVLSFSLSVLSLSFHSHTRSLSLLLLWTYTLDTKRIWRKVSECGCPFSSSSSAAAAAVCLSLSCGYIYTYAHKQTYTHRKTVYNIIFLNSIHILHTQRTETRAHTHRKKFKLAVSVSLFLLREWMRAKRSAKKTFPSLSLSTHIHSLFCEKSRQRAAGCQSKNILKNWWRICSENI